MSVDELSDRRVFATNCTPVERPASHLSRTDEAAAALARARRRWWLANVGLRVEEQTKFSGSTKR